MFIFTILFFGLTKAGTFVQVTDLHYDLYYREGTPAQCWRGNKLNYPCCHSWEVSTGPRKAGRYGDYLCDSPQVLLNATMEFITQLNPDFIIWTGDNPGHNLLTQTPDQNLQAIKIITDMFRNYLPGTTVYPAYGNHDTYPVDQIGPDWSWLFNPVSDYWAEWLPEQKRTLCKGGYYSVKLNNGVRLVSLNTIYYDTNNVLKLPVDPADQMNWFFQILDRADHSGESVWVIAHIPPGNGEVSQNYSRWYNSIISRYKSVVKGQFFGHTHKDQFTLIRNIEEPTSVLYIAPSVTPYRHINPSVRVYEYEGSEITDYVQYFANLTEANLSGSLEFQQTYRASSEYALENLNLQSWQNLINRFEANDPLFQKWYNNRYGKSAVRNCNSSCKRRMIAGMQSSL